MAGSFSTTCELDFSFSFFAFADARSANAARAHRLGALKATPPLVYVVNDTSTRKSLPPYKSFAWLEGNEALMTAFKPSESADSSAHRLIVRVFEPTGNSGSVKMNFASELAVQPRGERCDLCEKPKSSNTDVFALSPWEIATLSFKRLPGA